MVREGNNLFIVIGAIIIIGASGEAISTIQGAGQVLQDVVEFQEGIDVTGHMAINLLRVAVVGKTGMVDEDLHWQRSTSKQMSPMQETVHKAHEFLVPNVIVSFSFHERARGSSHHALLSPVIKLK